jgi:CheY-like chemotaxis protein
MQHLHTRLFHGGFLERLPRHRGEPHLFIIDDNRADVELIQVALEECATRIVSRWFSQGTEAIAALRSETGVRPPRLILMDVSMPRLDGYEVASAIRALPSMHEVPIVMWSTSGEANDRRRAKDIGAERYLVKPSDFSGYLSIAHWIVERCQCDGSLASPSPFERMNSAVRS